MTAVTPIEIYQEMTPNPDSLKFVTNRELYVNGQVDFRSAEALAGRSDLAEALFRYSYVKGVFVSQNFVTITKAQEADWFEITPEIKMAIKTFLEGNGKPVSDELLQKANPFQGKDSNEPLTPDEVIIDLLEKYVRPAVEGDGGHIAFHSFEDGVVKLIMQGSCSGCPSSQITLKAGIEGLLKRMVPDVKEVVAIEE